MLIAQISDTYIKPEGRLAYRKVDTAQYLARAVEHVLAMMPQPDAVLATGDLVDAGQPDEYRRLHRLLAPLPMPVYLIPGNHDDRAALVAEFDDTTSFRAGDFSSTSWTTIPCAWWRSRRSCPVSPGGTSAPSVSAGSTPA
jgi:3',5'-cyclic AMP phosphodiesterase CpdA